MARSVRAYVDRRSGRLVEDPLYSNRFLRWAYGHQIGWWLTDLLLSRPLVSRLYGWFQKLPWSRRKIPDFVRSMGVNMGESLHDTAEFRNFNDFIARRIDLTKRPVDPDPSVCVAPADGRLLAFPAIHSSDHIVIKRAPFDLRSFLRDRDLVEAYDGGALVVGRLYLADYHHFHFPVSGVPRAPIEVPGRYHAVTPYSPRRLVPYFAVNHRMITAIESDRFGQVMMIEIGSFTVGSIRQRFTANTRVKKGDHKGWFELGGSVVALLFERGMITLDEDLCRNTRDGVETFVRLGERIGGARH